MTLRFHQAVLKGDAETQREILTHVIEPICRVRDLRKGYAVSYVKAAVNLLGLLGPEGAAALHSGLVRHALATAVQSRIGPVELWCTPDEKHPLFERCAAESGPGQAQVEHFGLRVRFRHGGFLAM